jgi:hypothetical protein
MSMGYKKVRSWRALLAHPLVAEVEEQRYTNPEDDMLWVVLTVGTQYAHGDGAEGNHVIRTYTAKRREAIRAINGLVEACPCADCAGYFYDLRFWDDRADDRAQWHADLKACGMEIPTPPADCKACGGEGHGVEPGDCQCCHGSGKEVA